MAPIPLSSRGGTMLTDMSGSIDPGMTYGRTSDAVSSQRDSELSAGQSQSTAHAVNTVTKTNTERSSNSNNNPSTVQRGQQDGLIHEEEKITSFKVVRQSKNEGTMGTGAGDNPPKR